MQSVQKRTAPLFVLSTILTSFGQGFMFVGVPWLLLQQEGGKELLGIASFAINLAILILAPVSGAWMDRSNRKRALVMLRAAVALFLLTLLIPAIQGAWSEYVLIGTLALANFFIAIDQSARAAYLQAVYPPEKYRAFNTVMELQHQFAHLVVGAFLAILVARLNIVDITLTLAVLFAFSTVTMVFVQPTQMEHKPRDTSLFKALSEGAKYLRKRPRLNLIANVSYWPYIVIQTGNFLVPVLIVTSLEGSIADLAIYEMSFAIGAICVAFFASRLMDQIGPLTIINGAMLLFAALIVVQVVWTTSLTVVWLACFAGFANSAIRIGRNSWLMTEIPSEYIARSMSFYQTIMMALKTASLGAAVWLATATTAWHALALMAVVQVFATAILLTTVAVRAQPIRQEA